MTEREEALDPNTPAARLKNLAEKSLSFARLVAQNPAAPPDLLHQFASTYNQDPALLTLVISNPNTPKEALIRFGWSQPGALLKNPIFEILLLEDPLLLQSIPEPTLFALVSHPGAPLLLLEQNIGHTSERVQIKAFDVFLSRVNVTPELLAQYANHSSPAIQVAVVAHPASPLALLEDVLSKYVERWWVMSALAENPKTTPQMLALLSEHKSDAVLRSVAKHPQTTTEVLTKISRSTNLPILRAIAAHANTEMSTLEILSHEQDEEMLLSIAKRELLSPPIIERLCGHPTYSIRAAIWQNKDAAAARRLFYRAGARDASLVPAESLDELPSPDPSLSRDELTTLSRGMSYARYLAALHPSTTAETLAILAQDSDSTVRRAVIRNPNASAEILLSMKHDKEESIRSSLLYHPNCSMALFYALAADRSLDVRLALASYEKAPHKILKNLFEENADPKGHIKKAIARNSGIDPTWLLTLAKYHDIGLRQSVAKNMSATPEILQLLAGDESDRVRLVVTQHPKLSEDLLTTLCEDDAASVSAEAKKNKARRSTKNNT